MYFVTGKSINRPFWPVVHVFLDILTKIRLWGEKLVPSKQSLTIFVPNWHFEAFRRKTREIEGTTRKNSLISFIGGQLWRFLCQIDILKVLVEKFVKLKGLRGKVRLLASSVAKFDDFCAKLTFWSSPSKNSWKFEKNSSNCLLCTCSVAVQSFLQFDEFFRPKSNFRFFEVFFACNLQKAYITKNSRHLACILFNLTNFFEFLT